MMDVSFMRDRAMVGRMEVRDKLLILNAAEEIEDLRRIKDRIKVAIGYCMEELKRDDLVEGEGADLRGRIDGLRVALGFFTELEAEEVFRRKRNEQRTSYEGG
jgi:hypothetical protein